MTQIGKTIETGTSVPLKIPVPARPQPKKVPERAPQVPEPVPVAR